MATYSENIAKIRGSAVYGPDMRNAIAEAIEQSQGMDGVQDFINRWQIAQSQIEQASVTFHLTLLDDNDYKVTITGR